MNKNIIIILSFLILSACTTKATTEQTEKKPETVSLSKPEAASLQLKSAINSSVIFINEDKWQYQKVTKEGSATEFNFQIKDNRKDVIVGRMITEKISPDLQFLTKVAFDNAAKADPDAQILRKEFRNINGNEVIYMEMAVNTDSTPFTIYGVYHSNKDGATQLLGVSESTTPEVIKEIQDFLSGFDTVNK